jgi:hypothetical protein
MMKFRTIAVAMALAVPVFLGACSGCSDDPAAGVGAGETCGGETACESGLVCAGGTCQEGGAESIGADCTEDSECSTLRCVDGQCAPGESAVGDACTDDAQCATANCTNGQCEEGNVVEGDECVVGDQCASGNCVNGTCAPEGATGGDGGPSNLDGGDPFEQSLEEFCAGGGAVVAVGGSEAASACGGDLAQNVFRWAICACDTVTSNGAQAAVTTDSFDSNVGPYGGDNIGDDGHVGVNGVLVDKRPQVGGTLHIGNQENVQTPLQIPNGSAYVRGDLYVFGDGQAGNQLPVNGDAYIAGDMSGGYNIAGTLYHSPGGQTSGSAGMTVELDIPQQLPCPCENLPLIVTDITDFGEDPANNDNDETYRTLDDGTTEPAPIDPGVWADPGSGPDTLSLPCGRYYFSSINRSTQATIIAEGRVVIMVGGDMNIGGGISVQTEDDAEIDIFVEGSLTIGGTGTFGRPDRPALVRTYVWGPSVTIDAATVVGGNLYAPNAAADFGASGDFYGAVFVDEFLIGASTQVHFDSAIRSAGDVCPDPGQDPPDAGPGPGNDGGVAPPADAGPAPGSDGGVNPPADAGPQPDAGPPPPPPDAGPDPGGPECNDRCDLTSCTSGEACLIDGNTGDFGVCGACTTSLDCCAPLVCAGGSCVFIDG